MYSILKYLQKSHSFGLRNNNKLPSLPSIGGDEGVGEVVDIGRLVCKITPGERVVLSSRLLGSWCYYGIYHERDVHVVSKNIPLPEAAMLTLAPCTAYRMIKDFTTVKPGDTVAQNAANSSLGQCVIQLCKAWGINTFNIVPNHNDYEAVKAHLLRLGATSVCTLEEAEELTAFDTSLSRPILALNCLGGKCEDVILKLLSQNGTVIYYGDAFATPMVKQSLRHDATFCRFHLNDWNAQASSFSKYVMLNEIAQLMVIRKFVAPAYEAVELKNYITALRNTSDREASCNVSYIFDFTLPY